MTTKTKSEAELAAGLEEADARQRAGMETTPKTETLYDLVKRMEPQFARALPRHVDVDRFTRLALTALRTVPRLLECTPASVLAGLTQAAQLGLEIDAVRGQAYLIPRWNGRTRQMEASFQLGYKGLIDLAGRGGITVRARTVRANDRFVYEDGLEPKLIHVPKLDGPRGESTAFYTVAQFADGRAPEFLVMGRLDVEEVRDRFGAKSDGKPTGPWVDHFDAMGLKTVIIRLLNYLPLPVEILDAILAAELQAESIPHNVTNDLPLPPALPPADEATTTASKGEGADGAPRDGDGGDAEPAAPAAEGSTDSSPEGTDGHDVGPAAPEPNPAPKEEPAGAGTSANPSARRRA